MTGPWLIGWLLLAACALLLTVPEVGAAGPFSYLEPLRPPRPFGVMAHRGAARPAPENTRAALVRCIEDGFEWAEVDVRLTSDRHHVLWHDRAIRSKGTESWLISERTLAELQQLDVGVAFAARYAGERILTLRESLALAKGKLNLCLDCKDVEPEQLVRDVLETGMEQQVVVYDAVGNLGRFHAVAPGRVALMAKWHPNIQLQPWVESNHLAAVEIDAQVITRQIVAQCHDLGLKVEAKVIGAGDTPAFWDRSIAAGADWLQTDFPEEVHARALWQRTEHRPVRFSLHRGAGRYAPENTLPAFEKALRLGADFVEFDVRTSRDGEFYLLHDSTLDGETSGQGRISETPSSVIQTLSAGIRFGGPFADVPLPTLDQFLTCVKGKVDLYFDAKAITPEALAAAVERHGVVERTVVYQTVPYLLRLRKIDPRIRALPPLTSLEQLPALAAQLKPYGVDVPWGVLSKDLISQCHDREIRVFSDALGEHERLEDYLQAIDWGIDLIQTDHPMKLLRAMELRLARGR